MSEEDKSGGHTHMCSVCQKVFSRPHRLQQHMRVHTGERPYTCTAEGCERSYTRPAHLKRHFETSHVVEEKVKNEIRCTYDGCSKIYGTNSDLKKHVGRVHEGVGRYKCSIEGCNETFHKKTQLRSHENQHTGSEPFRCTTEDCNKTFSMKSHLERHKKVHEGYKCREDGCGLVFKVWTLLRKHMAVDHVKEFLCKDCGKKFHSKGKYRRHSHMHEEYRDMYECPEEGCERAYCDMKNLKTHVRFYHEGQRFNCIRDDCEKTFSSKQKMIDHQKMHDPNRPLPKKKKRGTRKISLASRLSLLQDKDGRSMSLVHHPDNPDIVSLVVKDKTKPATTVRTCPNNTESNVPQQRENELLLNDVDMREVENDDEGTEPESEGEGEIIEVEACDSDAYDSEMEKAVFKRTSVDRVRIIQMT